MNYGLKQNLQWIMKWSTISFFLLFYLFFHTQQAFASTNEVAQVYYFYINTCEECSEAEDIIWDYSNELKSNKNSNPVKFLSYNIVEQKNMLLLQEFYQAYHVPKRMENVPVIFAGDTYYIGQDEIIHGLDELSIHLENGTMAHPLWTDGLFKGEEKIFESFDAIKTFNVFVIGFINGLNPCSLSMLLLFLSLLMVKPGFKIIRIGMAYVLGKFVAYLLLGTLFYGVLQEIDMAKYQIAVKIFIATFVTILAYLNIKDFFHARKEKYGRIKNQLPSTLRKLNHNIIGLFSHIQSETGMIFTALILGGIISVGEFLCTGQVYLTTIVYVLQSESHISIKAFSYLLIYSFSFAIPTIIIIVILSRTRKLMELSELIRKNMPLIKLLTAAALIVVGLATLFFT